MVYVCTYLRIVHCYMSSHVSSFRNSFCSTLKHHPHEARDNYWTFSSSMHLHHTVYKNSLTIYRPFNQSTRERRLNNIARVFGYIQRQSNVSGEISQSVCPPLIMAPLAKTGFKKTQKSKVLNMTQFTF